MTDSWVGFDEHQQEVGFGGGHMMSNRRLVWQEATR
jgi:hypothetical protein